MKDDVRLCLVTGLQDVHLAADVAQVHRQRQPREHLAQLGFDAEQVVFRMVEQHQVRRLAAGDLARELAADGAAAARDQHPAAGKAAAVVRGQDGVHPPAEQPLLRGALQLNHWRIR